MNINTHTPQTHTQTPRRKRQRQHTTVSRLLINTMSVTEARNRKGHVTIPLIDGLSLSKSVPSWTFFSSPETRVGVGGLSECVN